MVETALLIARRHICCQRKVHGPSTKGARISDPSPSKQYLALLMSKMSGSALLSQRAGLARRKLHAANRPPVLKNGSSTLGHPALDALAGCRAQSDRSASCKSRKRQSTPAVRCRPSCGSRTDLALIRLAQRKLDNVKLVSCLSLLYKVVPTWARPTRRVTGQRPLETCQLRKALVLPLQAAKCSVCLPLPSIVQECSCRWMLRARQQCCRGTYGGLQQRLHHTAA